MARLPESAHRAPLTVRTYTIALDQLRDFLRGQGGMSPMDVTRDHMTEWLRHVEGLKPVGQGRHGHGRLTNDFRSDQGTFVDVAEVLSGSRKLPRAAGVSSAAESHGTTDHNQALRALEFRFPYRVGSVNKATEFNYGRPGNRYGPALHSRLDNYQIQARKRHEFEGNRQSKTWSVRFYPVREVAIVPVCFACSPTRSRWRTRSDPPMHSAREMTLSVCGIFFSTRNHEHEGTFVFASISLEWFGARLTRDRRQTDHQHTLCTMSLETGPRAAGGPS